MTKTIAVQITGISPLLMHAFPMKPIEALEKQPIEVQAEMSAYRDPNTRQLYVPGVNVQRCLVAGAAYSKGKGRATLAKPAGACLLVEETHLWLATDKYEIDARPVVIPATKGRVVRYRPRIDKWGLAFTLSYDDTLLSEVQVRKICDDGGSLVGVLDFRPAKGGPYGRFRVDSWQG